MTKRKGEQGDNKASAFQGRAQVTIVELYGDDGESLPPIAEHLKSGKAATGYVKVGGRTYKLIDAEAHARLLEKSTIADMLPPDAQVELNAQPEHEGGVRYSRARGKKPVNWLTTNVMPMGNASKPLELNVADQEEDQALQLTISEPANVPGGLLSVWQEGREVFMDCIRFPVVGKRGAVADVGLCLADVMPENPNPDPNELYRMTIILFDGFQPSDSGLFKPLHVWQVLFSAYDVEELEPEETEDGGVVAFRVVLKNARVMDAGTEGLN